MPHFCRNPVLRYPLGRPVHGGRAWGAKAGNTRRKSRAMARQTPAAPPAENGKTDPREAPASPPAQENKTQTDKPVKFTDWASI